MKRILNYKKIAVCIILSTLILQSSLTAQKIGTWKEFKAYQEAIAVVETPNKVFAVYDGVKNASENKRYGSLLSYSPEDQAVKTYGKSDGLNDVGISLIAYSKDADALAIIYGQNSNIDILTKNGITNVSSIKDNIIFQDKTINNIEIDGSQAYLSTAFGVIVIDLKKIEIKSTYKLDKNTKSVCQFGEYLYAATSEGVFRGRLTATLSDKRNWETFSVVSPAEDKNIEKLLVFNSMLVHYRPGPGVFFKNTDGVNKEIEYGVFRQLSVNQDLLVLTGLGYISFISNLNKLSEQTSIEIKANGVSSLNNKTTFWIAADSTGLVGIKKEINSSDFTIISSGIKVNSPKRNLTYHLTYSQDKLLVTGGSRSITAKVLNPGTLMVYEKGSWFNFNETEIAKKSGIECLNFTSSVVDPRDPNHYFVSSYGEGVYEFLNNEFVNRYTYDNSTLETALPNNLDKEHYVNIDGLTYDKDNNLYMTNSEAIKCIATYSSDNKWTSTFYEGFSGLFVNLQQIVIDKNNRKWVNLPRGKKPGIFVFDDKGTNPFEYYSSDFTDQQNNKVQATGCFCVAEDLNGTIWVGTDNGPISFSNPTQVQQGKCNRVVVSGTASDPYYLLYGQKITAIAVDGGNRKWFGTASDGVFCVDINGNDVKVTNFTTENSLLISNTIHSIAINNKTGEVFIATDKGLVSYMGEAISGKEDYSNVYAYPNPVNPATDDVVVITGLMANSTVKITDLNGNLITQGTSAGGQFTWNCCKRNGQKVTSGIYLVLGSTPDGKKGVATKIMVIK